MHRQLQLSVILVLVAIATGCRQEGIRVYDVPRQPAASAVKIALPQGWEEAPLGEMRVGSYTIRGTNNTKADLGIVSLPNMGGRDLENVNRWRSSVGQKPLTEEDLAKLAQTVTIGGLPGKLYELSGPSAETDDSTRILGAIVVRESATWYFKMTGNDKLVAAQKPALLAFLQAYPFPQRHEHNEEAPAQAAGGDPHAGLNMASAPPTPEPGPPQRSWPAPASWQQQAPGMMQQAKFSVSGGKAAVTVSEAGGAMGMNVNRWRGQIGLAPLSDAEADKAISPLDLSGTQAKLVDLVGEQQRMIVIIVPNGDTSIFYKLMGEPAAVAAEKDALINFAKKAK